MATVVEPLPKQQPKTPGVAGWLVQFADAEQLLDAASKTTAAGLQDVDAFSPYPIHGLDAALGMRRTRLPWLVLGAGLTGTIAAILLQWWTNAVDYPFSISGKPLFSLPANIPVAFELTILFSAFAAFFGMLMLNRLPRLSNPLLRQPEFRRVTDDAFFLYIPRQDKCNAPEQLTAALEATSPQTIISVPREEPAGGIPRAVKYTLIVLGVAATVPPLMILQKQNDRSDKPRVHIVPNMDFQPSAKPQNASSFFADGRAARPQVQGTIARGDLEEDDAYYRGIQPDSEQPVPTRPTSFDGGAAADPASSDDPAGSAANDEPAPSVPPQEHGLADDLPPEPNWITEFPVPVTDELMERGRQRYNIYCAVCHGLAGDGDGLVARRAVELQQSTWVPPTSLHSPPVREQPVGKLFNTVTHGIRKMPGYASQISTNDRWAVVLYVRALQRSRAATIDDVPEDLVPQLRELP